MTADTNHPPQTPALWTKCWWKAAFSQHKPLLRHFHWWTLADRFVPACSLIVPNKLPGSLFLRLYPPTSKTLPLQSQVCTAPCAWMLCNKVLVISEVLSLLMQVFQHLTLKSPIYSFVKTASEAAKLHNYTKNQNLKSMGRHEPVNLTYFSMQSKTDLCIYYYLAVALLLHNDIRAAKSLSHSQGIQPVF